MVVGRVSSLSLVTSFWEKLIAIFERENVVFLLVDIIFVLAYTDNQSYEFRLTYHLLKAEVDNRRSLEVCVV